MKKENEDLRSPGCRWRARGVAAMAALLATLSFGASGGTPALAQGTISHGPFEIVAGARRVSTGAFPNQGGNPFATREVSEFQLRWKGKPVATASGQRDFWRVLRLPGAPQPAVLLVTDGFVLVSEDAAGQLRLQPIRSESGSPAEAQWLDVQGGQPGPSQTFGIQTVTDLQSGTQLQGGRWLRLGSRGVLDVATLAVHPVEPWVPIQPGVPVTSLSREGDTVRAFSPGRGHYVLAASGIDHASPQQGTAWGLLVVEIASGIATELRIDRQRFRFADPADLDAAWIDHHFAWQRDASGRERLQHRARFAPWPWRARLHQTSPGAWQLDVPRIDAAFIPVLDTVLMAEPAARLTDRSSGGKSLVFTLGGCALRAQAFGSGSSSADNHLVSVWPTSESGVAAPAAVCEAALRRLAQAIDAELATRRHDALLKLN